MEKSYYDMVTDIVTGLDKLYDRVGGLRDAASQEEKEIYNNTRGVLGSVANSWREFADSLPPNRAEMLLPGWKTDD
jgi:hypothetical protein